MKENKRKEKRIANISRRFLKFGIAVTLVLMLSGCASLGGGSPVPEPILDYDWSIAQEAIMPDGELKLVKCLTVEDKRRIDTYIELMKASNALGGS